MANFVSLPLTLPSTWKLCPYSRALQHLKTHPAKVYHGLCKSSHAILPSMLGTFGSLEGSGKQIPATLTTRNRVCTYMTSLPLHNRYPTSFDSAIDPKWESTNHGNQVVWSPHTKTGECMIGTPSEALVFASTPDDSHQTLMKNYSPLKTPGSSISCLAFSLSSSFCGFFLILATFLLRLIHHLVASEDAAVGYVLRAPVAGWAGYMLMCLQKLTKQHRANSDPGEGVSLVS